MDVAGFGLSVIAGLVSLAAVAMAGVPSSSQTAPRIARKTVSAPDGVTIVYSVAGTGEPTLVFVHGGLADRSFWDAQLSAFAARHRVIALDLAGHGESGTNRTTWGVPAFGSDVKAVVEAEHAQRAILFGNSLGGPVVVEAALQMPTRVIGVVGVDTFQRVDYVYPAEQARQRAEGLRKDFAGFMKDMVRQLFHPDADPALVADAERRMMKTSPEAAHRIISSLAGFDMGAAVRRLNLPLRAINGDLMPTNLEEMRRLRPGSSAIVMTHIGHYPMLERPEEFNRHVATVVAELSGAAR